MTDRATSCNPAMPGSETRGVDPTFWSAVVAAVAALGGALGGVLIGRATTRSESQIAREDEYRREARAAAASVITATRNHDSVFFTLPGKIVRDSSFDLRGEEAKAWLSEYDVAFGTLRNRTEDLLLLVDDRQVRSATSELQGSADLLYRRVYDLIDNSADEPASDGNAVNFHLVTGYAGPDDAADRFRETCRERLPHVIVEERERVSLSGRVRRWLRARWKGDHRE